MREVSGGERGGVVSGIGRSDRQAAGPRLEYAVAVALLVVAGIAVLVTAGSKVLARWLGAE
jgi:hypothetical protein